MRPGDRFPGALPGLGLTDELGPGPVYQGVCKAIRRALRDGALDRDADAGVIAAARSCARSIDHLAGHNLAGKVAAGMQQAALHAALLAWLDRLAQTAGGPDPFAELLADLQTAGMNQAATPPGADG
jgi:hypothetical protein